MTARVVILLLCWTVSASLVRVMDGDTMVVNATIWSSSGGPVVATERIRVLGVDTPERGDQGAIEATVFTQKWLEAAGGVVTVYHCKRDSFGRILGTVTRTDGADLSKDLIRAKLGVAR